MSDPRTTVDEYLKVTIELKREVDDELVMILKDAEKENTL